MPVGNEAVPDHHSGHDDHGDGEIDKTGDDRAGGNDEPGKVDFRDEVGVGDETVARLAEGIGEELPGQHAGHDEERIGDGRVGVELGNAAEDDGENHHSEEGADDSPGDTDDGLFIADEDVAPGEEIEELAKAPEVSPVIFFGASGFEDDFGHNAERVSRWRWLSTAGRTPAVDSRRRFGLRATGARFRSAETCQRWEPSPLQPSHCSRTGGRRAIKSVQSQTGYFIR